MARCIWRMSRRHSLWSVWTRISSGDTRSNISSSSIWLGKSRKTTAIMWKSCWDDWSFSNSCKRKAGWGCLPTATTGKVATRYQPQGCHAMAPLLCLPMNDHIFFVVWDLYPDFVGICPCANPALAAILFPPNRRTYWNNDYFWGVITINMNNLNSDDLINEGAVGCLKG